MVTIVVSELESLPRVAVADGCVHVLFQVFVAIIADKRVTVKCLCHNPQFFENPLQTGSDRPTAEWQTTLVFVQLVYFLI